jgi:hypothetical protein
MFKEDFFVGFEVFTAVAMVNVVLWDMAPCRSCRNRRCGGKCFLQLEGRKIRGLGASVAVSYDNEPQVFSSIGSYCYPLLCCSLLTDSFYPELDSDM